MKCCNIFELGNIKKLYMFKKITKIMKIFKGDKYRSNFIQNLAFGSYNKNIKNAKSKNSWICSNNETVESYDNDELCGFIFTLNGFENLFRLMKEIYQKDGWTLNKKDLPILFIAGSNETVIIDEEKWNESQEFLKKIGYSNVTGKLYKNLRDGILNEKINNKFMKILLILYKKEENVSKKLTYSEKWQILLIMSNGEEI